MRKAAIYAAVGLWKMSLAFTSTGSKRTERGHTATETHGSASLVDARLQQLLRARAGVARLFPSLDELELDKVRVSIVLRAAEKREKRRVGRKEAVTGEAGSRGPAAWPCGAPWR